MRSAAGRARTIRTVVLPSAARRDRQRGAARGRPRRGRDGAVAVHDRVRRDDTNWSLFNGHQHRAVGADLPERRVAVPGSPGPGVGRGAHADPDRVHLHHPRPARDGLLLPPPGGLTPLDEPMRTEEHLASTVADVTTCRTEASTCSPTGIDDLGARARRARGRGAARAGAAGTRARLRAPRRRGEVQRPHRDPRGRPRHRRQGDHRVHRAVGLRQDHGAAVPQPHARHHAGRARCSGR